MATVTPVPHSENGGGISSWVGSVSFTKERGRMDTRICSICDGPIEPQRKPDGEIYWEHGHNAWPINDGRCCTSCNDTVVVTRRISRIDRRLDHDKKLDRIAVMKFRDIPIKVENKSFKEKGT